MKLKLTLIIINLVICYISYAQLQWEDFQIEYRNLYYKIEKAENVEFTKDNLLFIAGMSTYLMENCTLRMSYEDRLQLEKLVKAGIQSITIGTDYSNPDMRRAWQDPIKNRIPFVKGIELIKLFQCNNPHATKIASNILSILESQSEDSIFLKTCTNRHTEEKCKCLAEKGIAVIPKIHEYSYSPQLVKRIIEGNPIVGIQIVSVCGIVEY